MKFLERSLEDIIYQTSNKELRKRGLLIGGFKKRQVKIGNYGTADLVTFKHVPNVFQGKIMSHDFKVTIYELKKDEITLNTFAQACRYREGILRYLNEVREIDADIQVDIVLVGKRINGGDFTYTIESMVDTYVCLYDYRHDGIDFDYIYDNYKLNISGF